MAEERLSIFEYFDKPIYQSLRQLTQNDPESKNFTTDKALREVHSLVEQQVKADKDKKPEEMDPQGEVLGQVPHMVAETITELAASTRPADQGRLAHFASQLYRQTEIHPDTGAPLKYDKLPLWTRDLSLMYSVNRAWRDWEASGFIEKCSDDIETSPARKARWESLIAFAAQLTQDAPRDVDYCDNPMVWAHVGLATLKAAFEDFIEPHQLVGTTTLRAACLWLMYAADATWECVAKKIHASEQYSMPLYVAEPGRQFKDKNWTGFTEERWNVWVRGLEGAEAKCDASTDPETADMIKSALKKAKAVVWLTN